MSAELPPNQQIASPQGTNTAHTGFIRYVASIERNRKHGVRYREVQTFTDDR